MSTARTDASKAYAKKPYGKGYGAVWADIKESKGIVTKPQLIALAEKRYIAEGVKSLEDCHSAAVSSVGVVTSPVETSKGDCRGNFSAKGHLYYFAKLKRKTDENGDKEVQKLRFHWRKDVMPVKTRKKDADAVDSSKTAPATAPAKAVTATADATA